MQEDILKEKEMINKTLQFINAEIDATNETQKINNKLDKKIFIIGLLALLLNAIIFKKSGSISVLNIITMSALTASMYTNYIGHLKDKRDYKYKITKLNINKEIFEDKLSKLNDVDDN